MVQTIDGYDVAYTHRGSWFAYRRYRGKIIDEVPVAWDTDYTAKPPEIVIWFKRELDATDRLTAGNAFIAAMAKKRPGSASSDDIGRLFEVQPLETVPSHDFKATGLRCAVIGKCPPAGG